MVADDDADDDDDGGGITSTPRMRMIMRLGMRSLDEDYDEWDDDEGGADGDGVGDGDCGSDGDMVVIMISVLMRSSLSQTTIIVSNIVTSFRIINIFNINIR